MGLGSVIFGGTNVRVGLDENKPISPAIGNQYKATDTKKTYTCYVVGEWTQDGLQQDEILIDNSHTVTLTEFNGLSAENKAVMLHTDDSGDVSAGQTFSKTYTVQIDCKFILALTASYYNTQLINRVYINGTKIYDDYGTINLEMDVSAGDTVKFEYIHLGSSNTFTGYFKTYYGTYSDKSLFDYTLQEEYVKSEAILT